MPSRPGDDGRDVPLASLARHLDLSEALITSWIKTGKFKPAHAGAPAMFSPEDVLTAEVVAAPVGRGRRPYPLAFGVPGLVQLNTLFSRGPAIVTIMDRIWTGVVSAFRGSRGRLYIRADDVDRLLAPRERKPRQYKPVEHKPLVLGTPDLACFVEHGLKLSEALTTAQALDQYKVTRRGLSAALAEGYLTSRKLGSNRIFDRAELDANFERRR